jgi:hypothetical protein
VKELSGIQVKELVITPSVGAFVEHAEGQCKSTSALDEKSLTLPIIGW